MSEPTRQFRALFAARLAVGIALLGLVLWRVGWREPWRLLTGVAPIPLVCALLFYGVMYLLKTLRWRMMLRHQRIRLSLSEALELYLFSSLFGAFTPGRVGEAVRAVVPAREGKRYAESLACTAVDKACDVALLAVLLCAASWSSVLSAKEGRVLFWSGVALAGGLAVAYVVAWAAARRTVAPPAWLLRASPASWRAALADQPNRFIDACLSCVRQAGCHAAVLTALFWVAHVACHYGILLSLGGRMDLWYFVMCLTLSGLVEFVPVTVCGLGAREYLLILLFAKVGLTAELAVAFALMNLVFTYAVTGGFTLGVRMLRMNARHDNDN